MSVAPGVIVVFELSLLGIDDSVLPLEGVAHFRGIVRSDLSTLASYGRSRSSFV